MPLEKKSRLADSETMKKLAETQKSLNLIDGVEELEDENNFYVDTIKPTDSVSDENLVPAYKRRHNVPIYDDQYEILQAISSIEGTPVTELARKALDKIILEKRDEIGYKKIEEMVSIRKRIKRPKN